MRRFRNPTRWNPSPLIPQSLSLSLRTDANDSGSLLRFFGWLKSRHGPGWDGELLLSTVFGSAALGEHVQAYLEWLMKDRACKPSSCANYVSGLLNTLTFVLATEESAAAAAPCADQLLNLRLQLESQAREDRLYRPRDPNWIDWIDVQKVGLAQCAPICTRATADRISPLAQTRVKCLEAYNKLPATTTMQQKAAKLNDLLVLLFHSITPPDRYACAQADAHNSRSSLTSSLRTIRSVGVVRRLRIGSTLVKQRNGSWIIDLSKFRHKTSKCELSPRSLMSLASLTVRWLLV